MKTGPTPLDKSSARVVGRRRWSRRCSGNAQKAKGKLTSISSANFADAREVGHLCAESRSIHKQVLIVHEEGVGKKLGTSGLHPSMGADCLQGTTEYVAQIQPSNYTKAKNSYREEGGFWQIFWHDIPLLQGRKPAEMLSLTWLPGRWGGLCCVILQGTARPMGSQESGGEALTDTLNSLGSFVLKKQNGSSIGKGIWILSFSRYIIKWSQCLFQSFNLQDEKQSLAYALGKDKTSEMRLCYQYFKKNIPTYLHSVVWHFRCCLCIKACGCYQTWNLWANPSLIICPVFTKSFYSAHHPLTVA